MPVTVFHRKLITCRTDTGPLVLGLSGGLELQIPGVVVLGTPSGDEYRTTLDDGNVAGDKALPGVMVTRATGIRGTIATSGETELVEIGTVLGRLFPCVSTDRGPRRCLGIVSSAQARFSPSGSVSGSALSSGCDIRYSLLLLSLRQTGSICPCLSASISRSVYAVV